MNDSPHSLFVSTVDPVQIVVHGTVMYWFPFLLFRFILRRDVGAVAIADVGAGLLIADASEDAMAGGCESVHMRKAITLKADPLRLANDYVDREGRRAGVIPACALLNARTSCACPRSTCQ